MLEKSQLTLLSEEIKNNGKIENIIEIRDALSYDISSEGRISFFFPKNRAGVKIYYELTPWFSNHSDNENLAELDLNQFKPSKREKEDFDKLSNGDIKEFIVPIRNNELRVFRSININGQELIILLDTSRRLKDYRGSFK